MRRNEKEIKDFDEIESILKRNNVCRIALSNDDIPYIIPMNYGYKNYTLVFHSAKEGRKIDLIKNNPEVCFEITEGIEILKSKDACSFSTKYKSVIGRGKIEIINDASLKIEGLNVLMGQITNNKNWEYSKKALKNIVVLKLEIDELTGKQSGC